MEEKLLRLKREESRYSKYFMAGLVGLTLLATNAMGFNRGYEYGTDNIPYDNFFREPREERAIKKAVLGTGFYLGYSLGQYKIKP